MDRGKDEDMKVTNDIFNGITGLIEMAILDAVRLNDRESLTPKIVLGLAQNVAAQICQNLEIEQSEA